MFEYANNDSRHQTAGNHEEHIYADEATSHTRDVEVVKDDRDDGPGTQSINVSTKIQCLISFQS